MRLVQFLYWLASVTELAAPGDLCLVAPQAGRGAIPARPNFIGGSNMTTTYQGACFCGSVQIEVAGEPEGMGYCHCRSCRSCSGGPVNAFTLWKPAAFRVTAGAEHIDTFKKTPM